MLAALAVGSARPASAEAQTYADGVLSTPGLRGYWRLGETSGTAAADATGGASGTYVGGVGLGARGALSSGADTSVRFDGVDDEMRTGDAVVAGAATLEGWFFWEGGVAVMRDATSSGGWILAFDSGGRVAYRVGGTTVTTALAAADLRDGWHHLAVTASSVASAFYVDGVPVHNGAGAGTAAAAMPWQIMRNGTTSQYARGRADEVAVYDGALAAATIREHFESGRDTTDTARARGADGLDGDGVAGAGRARLERRPGRRPRRL